MTPRKDFKKSDASDTKKTDHVRMTPDGRPEHQPRLLGKNYFQRKKACPFSGPRAKTIDYKDVRLLSRFVSDSGKILPRHITGVSAIKQRELAIAIKRARMLALMPFTTLNQ